MKKKDLSPVTGLFSEQATAYAAVSYKKIIYNHFKKEKYRK